MSPTTALAPRPDPNRADLALGAPTRLAPFVTAGVLGPAEVHTAVALCRIGGESDPDVLLAVALAVRGPSLGHVCVDLRDVAEVVVPDESADADLGELAWPEPDAWRVRVAASPLVREIAATASAAGPIASDVPPLVLAGNRLYLDRYHGYEQRVLTFLRQRVSGAAATEAPAVDRNALEDGLARLWPDAGPDDRQRRAAEVAVASRFTVIAGGPGTGKTYTLARILALLEEQAVAADLPPPRVALAAPTGKAADRLAQAVREAAGDIDTDDATRARLQSAEASTLHRLLRWQPRTPSRFRHGVEDPLPHDVVIVDETSMVSVALMAKLVDAIAPTTRLILVGDPEQLTSIEAGAVLGDIVGPHLDDHPDTSPLGDHIVVLERAQRFAADSGIAALADAVRSGDADAAIATLRHREDLDWIETTDDDTAPPKAVVDLAAGAAAEVVRAAREGKVENALAGLEHLRVLCAHRRGPHGVQAWVDTIEQHLVTELGSNFDPRTRWYPGRPTLVTRNDHPRRLYNGDVGVVVTLPDRTVTVAFPDGDGSRRINPVRLEHVETVHALTIHKSQGSQFDHVVVALPDASSRLLTRELLYTAVTRGRERVTLVASEAAIRRAVTRRIARGSGLADALWPTV